MPSASHCTAVKSRLGNEVDRVKREDASRLQEAGGFEMCVGSQLLSPLAPGRSTSAWCRD